MKLTENDKALLKSWECPESDFSQIEDAFSITVYDLNGKRIFRKKAIELLGWEVYLSGIARSALHYTAYRETAAGTGILFDSSALFR